MEASDSSDNENDPLVKHRRQRERLAREEAFYRFVNSLSNDDYKLMRDNHLLGAIGEKTEEELHRSLQRIKNATQMPGFYPDYFMPTIEPRTFIPLGGSPSLHDVCNAGSTSNQLTSSFRQLENMIEREQRVNRSCIETSNSNISDGQVGANSNLRIQRQAARTQSPSVFPRSSRSEVSATETSTGQSSVSQERERNRSTIIQKIRARPESSSSSNSQNEILWRVRNPENVQRQIGTRTEYTATQTFPGPSTSEASEAVSLMNSPTTSSERREKSHSPELECIRARIEESSPVHSHTQIRRKVRNTGNTYRRAANSQSEPTSLWPTSSEVSATETSMDILPSRIQRRTRNTSPVRRRVRPRIESSSPPDNASFENIRVNEAEISPRIQQHEAVTEQPPRAGSHIKRLFTDLTSTNDFSTQTESNRRINSEPCVTRLRNQTPDSNLEVSFNSEREPSVRDNVANRSQVTPPTTSNTVTIENSPESRTRLSNTEQSHDTACIRTTMSTKAKVNLNNATLVITHRTLCQIMVELDQPNNLTNNDSGTDSDTGGNNDNDTDSENESSNRDDRELYCYSDFEHSDSFILENTEGENTESERDYGTDESEIYALNPNPSWDSYYPSVNSESSFFASYNSIYGSSDINLAMFENSTERSSLFNSSIVNRGRNQAITPSDDFDFWPIEDQLDINEDIPPTGGLSKQQIDMLTVRNFNENDASNSCTICLEEFREGNKIRTLPCSHTYHVHCIDAWLVDNMTCPICRRRVRPDGRGF
ncbi:E3 ubiquitin-protein ligase RLIM-like [Perognathus longimembris pacificus]|uniref:E3 ubiquitin-protein ligase RLIM-like n=1 Tax=Perognathus longimembris pacificus TaxID=214514 RepID=UPI0020197A8B|nr:E3 ubiquitin-protein ligase RLIM-like [Perognathus longimembris pacificus]